MEILTQAPPPPPVTEQKWRGWIQFLLALSLTFLFFYMMAPLVVPILLGAVCAIICYPIFEKCRSKLPQGVSAMVVTLGLAIGILAPIVFLLYDGTYRLIRVISEFKFITPGQSMHSFTEFPFIKKLITSASRFVPIDSDWINNQSRDMIQTGAEKASVIIGNFLSSMPSFFMAMTIVIISTFFFLADGAKFLKFLGSISPLKVEKSRELYTAFERSCRGVVLGLFASSFAQAVLMTIFFLITGLPNAVLIGLVTIIAGMVPLVGSAPLWIVAVLYHASHQAWGNMAVMLAGGVVISTIDNFIRPWIMKGQSEMHPLLALVSVFGAINLFGPMGIFLGPVIAAVFVSFLKILSSEIRRENKPAEIQTFP